MDTSKLIAALNDLCARAEAMAECDFRQGYTMALRHAVELVDAHQLLADLGLAIEKGQSSR